MTSPVHTAAYRSSHATSALSGVPSGPYAEPTRLVDLARLPPLVRSRLLMSIGEHASPAPLAEAGVHRPPLSGRTLAALLAGELPLSSRRWAFVSLAIAFVSLAVGFGRSLAPVWQAPLVATALVAALVLFRAARAAGVGPGHVAGLRPGVYLFPLDVVAIDGSSARVTPLGGVRSAALRERGDEATLDLSFHDGTHHRFEVRGAEVARLRHGLARSQSLLERLTFGHALDDAMANDLFFELRGRDGFADVLPDPRIQRARRVRGALLALATFGAGLGVFALRNARSDDIVWTDTVRSGRYDRYLEATEGRGRYTDAARDKIRRAALDVERAGDERSGAPSGDGRRAEPARVAPAPAPKPSAEPAVKAAALDRFRARARDADAAARMELTLVSGEPLRVVFISRTDASVDAAPTAALSHLRDNASRRRRVASALRTVISESIPASVLAVVEGGERSGPRVEIEETTSFRAKPLAGFEMVYDVAWIVPGISKPRTFRLTMPPPEVYSTNVRPRSLFRVAEVSAPVAGVDGRVYDAMLARDYDRLYDELYGLFFAGDPRVPVGSLAEVAPAFGVTTFE